MEALFHDRYDAGRKLSQRLLKYAGKPAAVLAIPRGGVPVAYEIARKLGAETLDLIIARKIPIPWNPEAGFGAVTSTGDVVLNEDLLGKMPINKEEIAKLSSEVYEEIKRRRKTYRGDKPFPALAGRVVVIVDDGLATGYTMMAAIKSVKRYRPKKIVVAVPVAPKGSVELVGKYADEVVALWSEKTPSFAVAGFYEKFPDLEDEEVIGILNEFHPVPPKS